MHKKVGKISLVGWLTTDNWHDRYKRGYTIQTDLKWTEYDFYYL